MKFDALKWVKKGEAFEKQMENLVSSGKAEKTRFSDANYQKS